MATSRYRPIPVLAGAAVLPCVFWTGMSDAFNLPKLLAAALAAAAAAAVGAAGPTRLDPPVLALAGAFLLGALCSIAPSLSWHGVYREYLFGAAGAAALMSAFWMGACAAPERLTRWALAGSLPVSAYALAQRAFGDPWVDIAGLGHRAASSLGDPVALGAYLALMLPLAASETARRSRLGAAALALALPALALTGSRGSWLAAAAGLLLLRGRRRGGALLPAGLLLAAALAVPALLARSAVLPGADSARAEVWRSAWAEFRRRPWLGSGPDTLIVGLRRRKSEEAARTYSFAGGQSHAHNDWLQVLATMGLLGGAAYAWLHVRFLKERGREAGPVVAALAALLVHAKFNSPGLAAAWVGAALAGSAFAAEGRVLLPRIASAAAALGLCALSAGAAAADRADRLGLLARAEGRPREAAAQLERAVARAPWVGAYRYHLANLLLGAAEGEPARARAGEVAYAGLERGLLDADAWRLLGSVELERGRRAQARKALEAADELDPTYAPTLRLLVRAAEADGDRDAKAHYQGRLERLTGKGE